MKSVDQVLNEPTPSTVNYRTENNRRTNVADLIDSVGNNTVNNKNNKTEAPQVKKLTWINGVFIPVLLNIWGVIMFLRLGWVVGQAGLGFGTLIVIIANLVTGITALSLCAICTNGEVKGGGVYYLISRALGPVYGGTIGLLFFIAQAVAVSLYVVGFAEAVTDLIIDSGGSINGFTGTIINDVRVIGIATAVVLYLMSLIGIGWYAKTQTALLAILLVAIGSIFIGAFIPSLPNEEENLRKGFVGFRELVDENGLRNLGPNFQIDPLLPTTTQSFFTVFAVFFPAVTGIMAGANLSGDIDNPSKAIPKGTLLAILVTFISYISLLWIIGLTCLPCVEPDIEDIENPTIDDLKCTVDYSLLTEWPSDILTPKFGLLYDKLIMKNVSLYSYLVYLGVFAATLSSALASLVGAPRILQSVANDQIFPFAWFNFFAAGRGLGNEPVRGYTLTFLITIGCCALGKLDVIAPIISNFFMISYALTNYACWAASTSDSPSWRPSFRYYNKYLSLGGAILCVVVMFLSDYVTALITFICAGLVMYYLSTVTEDINWGEASEAKKYTLALNRLEKLQLSEKVHVKTFRPQFLVMTGPVMSRLWLVKFISMFQAGGGVMLCADVLETEFAKSAIVEQKRRNLKKRHSMVVDVSTTASATSDEQLSKPNESSEGGNSSVRTLFQANVLDASRDKEESSTSSATNPAEIQEEKISFETAKGMAALYSFIKDRRLEGESLLNSKDIWSGRRCKGAFFETVLADNLFLGFQRILQLGGIGKLRPNTVVVGFKSDYLSRPIAEVADYEKLLRSALATQMGLVVVRDDSFVFDINMKKSSALTLPSFSNLIVRNDTASDISDKRELEQNFASMLDSEFEKESTVTLGGTIEDGNGKGKLKVDNSTSSLQMGERFEKYSMNDDEYIKKFESSLPSDVSGEFIDVWWLADDGGLTMLLPQLLIENPVFKDKKLRVMAVTNKFQNAEETSRLKKAEFRMVHLLNKFRIKATTLGIDLNLEEPLLKSTQERFEKLMGLQFSDLHPAEAIKTKYNLRLAEEMRKTSKDSALVFMVLPIPETSIRVKLHTVWLDIISYDMPPMVMMRGNNENVLTFFC